MAIYFKKKYFRDYTNKSDGVIAWQFTKQNFSIGAPLFIRRYFIDGSESDAAVVHLWSQYGGEVIAGELNINGAVVPIYEGDYIVKLRTDTPIDVVSRSKFEHYYLQFVYVSKWRKFLNWIFRK